MLKMHINQMSLILLLSFLFFRQVIFVQPQLDPIDPIEADALRKIATTLGATLVNSIDDPCQSRKLSISTANLATDKNNITCNYTDGTFSHVTSLKLKSMSLQGRPPPELVNLTFLQEIDLYQNNFSGELPKEWASLRHLNFISLVATGISGEIPKEWGNFANLTYLSLSDNQLSGTIPEDLGNLVSLTYLALSSNQFTGSLPETLANLTNLTDFTISDNNFSGTVPEFIGRWPKLQRLEMYSSGLEGPISPTIFALGNLKDLRITDMIGPKFDFPELNNTKKMEYLVLRNLNMSGSIPAYIWDMGDLKLLDLTFNKLEGEIIISTIWPTNTFLSGNMLNGTITDSFLGNLSQNKNFDLSYNNFTLSTNCPDPRPNINMYRSFTSKNMNGHFSCPSTPSCSNYFRSFHINCGGGDELINQTKYEGDREAVNKAVSNYDRKTNWGMISVGDFKDDTDNDGYTSSDDTQQKLYSTARGSPVFLTYYGYCLENGNYEVKLHFAEIVFKDKELFNRVGRRVFDIYIQGELRCKDFNIKEEANGAGIAVIRTFNAIVTDNTLDIRLYWAGKGTTFIPFGGYHGPLISAISVSHGKLLLGTTARSQRTEQGRASNTKSSPINQLRQGR